VKRVCPQRNASKTCLEIVLLAVSIHLEPRWLEMAQESVLAPWEMSGGKGSGVRRWRSVGCSKYFVFFVCGCEFFFVWHR